MDSDDARLLPEVDAVYAWSSRDAVIIEQVAMYVAWKRQNVFVEVEELETIFFEFDRCRRYCWRLSLERV